jgi:hypothetical protein
MIWRRSVVHVERPFCSLRRLDHKRWTLLAWGAFQTTASPAVILLIPGDPLTGRPTENGIQSFGYDVLVARTSANALELLSTNRRIRALVVDADVANVLADGGVCNWTYGPAFPLLTAHLRTDFVCPRVCLPCCVGVGVMTARYRPRNARRRCGRYCRAA